MLRQASAKQTNAQAQAMQPPEQTHGPKCMEALAAQAAKSSLSSSGNKAKDNVD